MRAFGGAGLASVMIGLLALMGPAGASDRAFDGNWLGAGTTNNGDCDPFEFTVLVSGSAVEGVALQTGDEYRITGTVTANGQFVGAVEFLWLTIAELTGDIERNQGAGDWRTIEGPDCTGTFWVRRH